MTSHCIHGFVPEHCASCRTCAHGQAAGACLRCRSAVTSRKATPPMVAELPQQHAGYEIFYAAEASGWRYRGADAAPSRNSYRSAFLARKAVDELGSQPVAVKTTARRRRPGS